MSEPLTAKVLVLRQEERLGPSGDGQTCFVEFAGPFDVSARMQPATCLAVWLEENDPESGTYQLKRSDGRTAVVHYPGTRRDAA